MAVYSTAVRRRFCCTAARAYQTAAAPHPGGNQMRPLSNLVQSYPASGIRKMFELAGQYQDVINLTVGEPAFDTPANIKDAAKQALDNNQTHYVSNAGIPELREAIAERVNQRFATACSAENVMVTFGGMEAIFFALLSTVNPGDEVILPDPGYPNYDGQLAILRATAVKIPVREQHHFAIQAADIEAAITPKTTAIILNSPSNPLGSVLPHAELAAIADVVKRHSLFLISDEVYDELIFDDHRHHSPIEFPAIRDQVLLVNSFSKTYAMTGWRVGYVVGHPSIIAAMPKLQEGIASCVPPFVQAAALEALRNGAAAVQEMRAAYHRKRQVIIDGIARINRLRYTPSAAGFYAFINITALGLTAQQFAEQLLSAERVLVVPGTAFGPAGEGYIRIVFAGAESMLQEALRRIKRFVDSLPTSTAQSR